MNILIETKAHWGETCLTLKAAGNYIYPAVVITARYSMIASVEVLTLAYECPQITLRLPGGEHTIALTDAPVAGECWSDEVARRNQAAKEFCAEAARRMEGSHDRI